jgi:hypothetical protein
VDVNVQSDRSNAVAQWLRLYGANRKIVDSTCDEVTEFYQICLILPGAIGHEVYSQVTVKLFTALYPPLHYNDGTIQKPF